MFKSWQREKHTHITNPQWWEKLCSSDLTLPPAQRTGTTAGSQHKLDSRASTQICPMNEWWESHRNAEKRNDQHMSLHTYKVPSSFPTSHRVRGLCWLYSWRQTDGYIKKQNTHEHNEIKIALKEKNLYVCSFILPLHVMAFAFPLYLFKILTT